jgi:aspartate racemase
LLDEIDKLARASADFGLLAANTPHLVFDDLAPQSPIPLISIVESTCQAAKKRGLRKLGLIGTRFTMQADFYPKVFLKEGIELVAPEPYDQDYIHDKYINELVPGKFLPETRSGLLEIIDRLKAKREIDGVILGGTELPLILRDERDSGIPFLDTTRIHAQAAVDHMFS